MIILKEMYRLVSLKMTLNMMYLASLFELVFIMYDVIEYYIECKI